MRRARQIGSIGNVACRACCTLTPPVRLARHETTTSTLSAKTVFRRLSISLVAKDTDSGGVRWGNDVQDAKMTAHLDITEDDLVRALEIRDDVLLTLLAADAAALAAECNHLRVVCAQERISGAARLAHSLTHAAHLVATTDELLGDEAADVASRAHNNNRGVLVAGWQISGGCGGCGCHLRRRGVPCHTLESHNTGLTAIVQVGSHRETASAHPQLL